MTRPIKRAAVLNSSGAAGRSIVGDRARTALCLTGRHYGFRPNPAIVRHGNEGSAVLIQFGSPKSARRHDDQLALQMNEDQTHNEGWLATQS